MKGGVGFLGSHQTPTPSWSATAVDSGFRICFLVHKNHFLKLPPLTKICQIFQEWNNVSKEIVFQNFIKEFCNMDIDIIIDQLICYRCSSKRTFMNKWSKKYLHTWYTCSLYLNSIAQNHIFQRIFNCQGTTCRG
jgi:hypothetical protein